MDEILKIYFRFIKKTSGISLILITKIERHKDE